MKFYGIADSHGLESFNPESWNSDTERFESDTRALSIMGLRANANRHRHAVVYLADVDGPGAREITALINKGEYPEALVKLKEVAKSISLMRSPGAEKSWKLIPNPDLDPYS
jgi:hypothetical protein